MVKANKYIIPTIATTVRSNDLVERTKKSLVGVGELS